MDNNDPNPMGNLPTSSSINHNEGTSQNAATSNFRNSLNRIGNMHDENSVRAHNMPIANELQPPSYPYLERNMIGAFQPHIHDVSINSDIATTGANLLNSFQSPQIGRGSLRIGGTEVSGVQQNNWGGMVTGTNFRSNAPLLNDIYRPMINRNILSVGRYMPEVHQPHNHRESMICNNVMTNEDQSNSLHCPEQIDGSPLNLRIQPNVLGEGISNNNGRLITTQPTSSCGPQAGGNILNLGGYMGHRTQSSNDRIIMSEPNARAYSRPFNFVQRSQGNVQHYYSSPNHRNLGLGGNSNTRYANINPHIITGISNESVPSQLQQLYPNNAWSIPTYSSMGSPLVGTVGSTFGQNQSGHPVPASVSQATKDVDLLDENKRVQPAKEDKPYGPRKGKRGRILAQSAAVPLRPSTTSDKPVPIAEMGGLTQTSEMILGPPVKNSKILPNSDVLHISSAKMTSQPSVEPSSPSPARTNPIFHLKWSGCAEPHHSIEEKCFLCKRSLMYAPKGPISQPSAPVAVAVLHCGHAFHDECLLCITPKEQSKDPPCIPCAIGTP